MFSLACLASLLSLVSVPAPAAETEWKLVWSDEFEKAGIPDPAKWGYEEGFVRNDEKQFYTKARKENARVEDGNLVIEARKERWKNPAYDPEAKAKGRGRRGPEFADYTSASLTTRGKAAWTHGKIEVRAKLPSGRGTWPAIWTLGTNIGQAGWPACGEIDIMEFVGYDPGIIHANIHTKKYNHVKKTGKGDKIKVPDASEAFHAYSVEWDSEKMEFFVDGKKYFTFKNEGTGEDVWPYDKDQYLILNLAIGGAWGGQKGIDDSAFPQRYLIDYVRVYQKAGAGAKASRPAGPKGPGGPGGPAAPTADEMLEAGRWAATRFAGIAEPPPPAPGLTVLANNDIVLKDRGHLGALRIGKTPVAKGLACHAVSKIAVRLPGPGKSFAALAGVATNIQTSGGRGSVVFSVSAGGKEAFRSGTVREGMAPVPVSIDLGGSAEFVLEVGDAGDGIACDQSVWSEAKATLADGKEVYLSDLSMLLAHRPAPAEPLFSFTCGGKPSTALLAGWGCRREAKVIDDARTSHVLSWRDPATGLEVRCEGVEYRDFPAVEWTVRLRNGGSADTPIIEGLQALDVGLRRGGIGGFVLHHAVGSPANGTDYGPLETPLGGGAKKRISGAGGRPTNTDLSYFNLEGGGEGTIIAVGWPGQWAAEFVRDGGDGIRVVAGQELTRFKLLPGEEVRTPLIALLFWQGDRVRSQNFWRRWMMAHSMPRPGGKLPPPQLVASSSRAYEEMIGANEANQILHIDRYTELGLKLDYWWMDAGWYVNVTGWPNVGTWEVDPKRFPKGFRPISDHAREKGMKILVWFEPERVTAGTWITENHPEWVLGGKGGGLLDLGSPDARKWLTDHVDRLITEGGIGLYREDFNMDPLGYWRGKDAPDRQGITEIRHVEGHLAYWDELRRRHPDMLIDTCASGGRRNDLETLRRAVPLWRSDYAYEPVGHQCMTYGISSWIPYHGTGTVATTDAAYYGGGFTPVDPYAFWSNAAPSLGFGIDVRVKEIDYAALRKLAAAWRSISPGYYGDFYPVTPYTHDRSAWIAWQFDRPEAGEGFVQAFRREGSIFEAARIPLRGLEAGAAYEATDLETGATARHAGRDLLDAGLPIAIGKRPGAAVILYKRR
jgi:alpha-galactosidase